MAKTLYMTKGLPASGKTTWALSLLADAPKGSATRVNKDDLRAMMHNSEFGKANERLVLRVRDAVVRESFDLGFGVVVVDDTNLAPKHEEALRTIAKEYGARFVVQDFTDVPLQECLDRNASRAPEVWVPPKVIRDMHKKWIHVPVESPKYDLDLPDAIIVDIDGTLAISNSGRSPYDWDRVDEDFVNVEVANFIASASSVYPYRDVILMSGRDSQCRDLTEVWLDNYDILYNYLYMRPEGDTRKDSIVKRELYEQHIKGKYNVRLVLDDRDQVVDLWRNELGLTCWQVNDGNF